MENKTPFTENTKEARTFLEEKGFKALSFFQGKKYVYPLTSTIENSKTRWIEKDYGTFGDEDIIKMTFLRGNISSLEDFKNEVNSSIQDLTLYTRK